MDRKFGRWALAAGLGLLLFPAAVAAQDDRDPAKIAARCIEQVNNIADRAAGRIGGHTRRAVHAINELQDKGKEDEAAAVARRAAGGIHETVENAVGAVRRSVEGCVRILKRLDAPEALIERVKDAGKSAAEKIGGAGRRGLTAIREALED